MEGQGGGQHATCSEQPAGLHLPQGLTESDRRGLPISRGPHPCVSVASLQESGSSSHYCKTLHVSALTFHTMSIYNFSTLETDRFGFSKTLLQALHHVGSVDQQVLTAHTPCVVTPS